MTEHDGRYAELLVSSGVEDYRFLVYHRPVSMAVLPLGERLEPDDARDLDMILSKVSCREERRRYERVILAAVTPAALDEITAWICSNHPGILEEGRLFTTRWPRPEPSVEEFFATLGRADPVNA